MFFISIRPSRSIFDESTNKQQYYAYNLIHKVNADP